MRIWLVRLTLLFLAAFSLSLVARNMLVQTADANGQTIPVALSPDDSVQVLLRNKLLQVDLLKVDVPEQRIVASTRKATRLDPLDFRPFLIAGFAARKAEQPKRAAELLAAAQKRQPRNFNIRRLLMEAYLIDGRYNDAAREILASTRLKSSDPKPLMQALALFGSDPSARQALKQILAQRGDWRAKFTTNVDVASLAPDLVMEIANSRTTPISERLAIVRTLVAAKQIERGYALWTQSFSNPALQKGKFPTDPDFEGWAQSSGFGWKFPESGDGVAEIVKDENGKGHVLDVEFFGGGATSLAEQPMLLLPGRYRLSIAGNHVDGQRGAGDYRWTINCANDIEPIAVLRVASSESSKFSEAGEFDVPAKGCAVQTLKMMVIPGEMSISMRSIFSYVGITRQ